MSGPKKLRPTPDVGPRSDAAIRISPAPRSLLDHFVRMASRNTMHCENRLCEIDPNRVAFSYFLLVQIE
jgi:hypothetical protein